MKKISTFVVTHPKVIIAVTIILTVFLGFFISRVYFDNEVSHIIPKKHPANIYDKEVVATFGSSDFVLIALESNTPEGVFTYPTLNRIEQISRTIEMYDYVDSVESLAVSKNIVGTKDSMQVGALWQEGGLQNNPEELQRIRKEAMNNPLFRKGIVSTDGTSAGILIKMKHNQPLAEIKELQNEFNAFTATMLEACEGHPSFQKVEWSSGKKKMNAVFSAELPGSVTEFIEENALLSNKFYQGITFSNEHVILHFAFNEKYFTGALADRVIYDVEKVLHGIPGDERVYYSGESVVNGQLGTYIVADLKLLVPVVILVVAIFLFIAFRTGRGILFPLISVLMSTVCTMGLMGLMNIPINQISVIIPVLLIGVGSSYGIHILNNYYEKIVHTDDKKAIIHDIITIVGRGVIMAGLTTVAGFASFITSDIPHMKHFGLFTALGIFTALCLNIVFITALLLLMPKPKKIRSEYTTHRQEDNHSGLNKFLQRSAEVIICARYFLLIGAIVITGIAIWGFSRVTVDTNTVEFFGKKSMVRRADTAINERFGGTNVMRIVVDGIEADSMKEPETLKKIENIQRYAETLQNVGKTSSFVDFIKLMNRAMNENKEEYYTIPDSKDLISQYLFLYSSSGDPSDFDSVVDFDYRKANIVIQITVGSTSKIQKIVQDVEAFAKKEFNHNEAFDARADVQLLQRTHLYTYVEAVESYEPRIVTQTIIGLQKDPAVMSNEAIATIVKDYALRLDDAQKNKSESLDFNSIEIVNALDSVIYNSLHDAVGTNAIIHPAGVAVLYVVVSKLIIDTQIYSIITSILIVLLINSLIFRSIAAGLTSIFPLTFTILVNFGVMGFTGTSLNMATSIIAAIAIGIGVDYAIHFLNRFLHEYRVHPDSDLSATMVRTMMTSGRAIIYNVLSVMFGFLVLCLSNFPLLRNVGWLLGLTMIVSGIGALTVLPAFLIVFKPRFIKKNTLNE